MISTPPLGNPTQIPPQRALALQIRVKATGIECVTWPLCLVGFWRPDKSALASLAEKGLRPQTVGWLLTYSSAAPVLFLGAILWAIQGDPIQPWSRIEWDGSIYRIVSWWKGMGE